MTDQIPAGITPEEAKKAREWALHALNKPGASNTAEKAVARVVIGTVPEPRPTLADMTLDERDACRRMQCDVEGRSMRYVIANPHDKDGEVTLLDSDGGVDWVFPEYVTPRPDLPRWEWPGTEKPAPAPAPALPAGWRLAKHQTYGRVIVTNTTPDPSGHVYYVTSDECVPRGSGWGFCTPAELTYLDQGADTAGTVPPNTLAVGSAWGKTDALAQACRESERDQIIALDRAGDAYVWSEASEWWESVSPKSVNAPYTILHAGKKADQ